MKKVLLCMLIAGLLTPAVAQEMHPFKTVKMNVYKKNFSDLGISSQGMVPVNPQKNIVDLPAEGWTCAGISKIYDRQSQGSVYPMTKKHDDGFIGATWTNEDNEDFEGSSVPKRGVGYACSKDRTKTWSKQENRIGGIPLYWPSYAQWGENGEAILARSADTYEHNGVQILNGLVLLTRENKGEGEWTITPLPYPEGADPADDRILAWGRMATSGDKRQYIHIMTSMLLPEDQIYKDYYSPLFYYKTRDGKTWEVEAELIPEMVGQQWDPHSEYIDGINFADTYGDFVACSFISSGHHGYVLKSYDNGDTWESFKFFDAPVRYDLSPEDYADIAYCPTLGHVAMDIRGKIHIVFSVRMVSNIEDMSSIGYYTGIKSSFLTYWNEDTGTIDGASEFSRDKIEPILTKYFDWEQSNDEQIYVISTVPKYPVIGYFTPTRDEHLFTIEGEKFGWEADTYGLSGMFSFPQMVFDANNTLHLAYLGLLDGSLKYSSYWYRHPYYTTMSDGVWTKTEHLANNIDLIDKEFAYLTLAGVGIDQMYLMAQVDEEPGTYISYSYGTAPVQPFPTDNYFYFFYIEGVEEFVSINDIGYTPLTMSVAPNPASGQATVKFDGKADITIYNLLHIFSFTKHLLIYCILDK